MSRMQQIDARAAAFLARRDGVNWTEAQERELASWIEESVEHRVSFLRIKASWDRLDRLVALQAPVFNVVEPRARPVFSRLSAFAAAAAVLLLVVFGALLSQRTAMPKTEVFTTAVGGRQTIPLTDGSSVELNTDSRLVAMVDNTARHVSLETGEAFFEIAHDPQHPFVVDAGAKRVVVLGTKFGVRRIGPKLVISVLDGRVRVEDGTSSAMNGKTVLALAGDQIVSEADRRTTLVKRGNLQSIEDALRWRDGILTFDHTTLGEAAVEFNRYNRRQLIVSGDAATVEIEGTFPVGDIDAFARILHDAYGFKVRVSDNHINIY